MFSFPKPTLGGERLAIVPWPLSVTVCGLPVALSVKESVPFTVPFASGVNVTETVHFAPTARVAVQVVVCANPEVGRIEVSETEVVPVLVTVTVFGALVVPFSCVPKVRLVGDNDIVVVAWARRLGSSPRVAAKTTKLRALILGAQKIRRSRKNPSTDLPLV
jgi:hypothetical protein